MTRTMTKLLSEDAAEQYRRDGFYVPVSVLDPNEAAAIRGALESSVAEYGGHSKGPARSHLLFRWLADLIRSPRLLDAVEDLIGPNIMCWGSQWWIKEPRSAHFVSWHQDSQYWGIDSDNLVSVWVALSPATVESGCIRCVPGSHLGPDMPHCDTWQDDNMLSRGQEIAVDVDEDEAVNIEVGAGEAALFAYRLAHASIPIAATTGASRSPFATSRPTPARPWLRGTARPWSGAGTRTVASSTSRCRHTTSIPWLSRSTVGRKRTCTASSIGARAGRSTTPDRLGVPMEAVTRASSRAGDGNAL